MRKWIWTGVGAATGVLLHLLGGYPWAEPRWYALLIMVIFVPIAWLNYLPGARWNSRVSWWAFGGCVATISVHAGVLLWR